MSKEELLEGYRKYYGEDFNEKEIANLIMMADADGNDEISLSEFMLTTVNHEKFLTIQRLESIFNEIDLDKNHRISLEELSTFLGNSPHLDKKSLADAFAQVDSNNRGEISFEEFQVLINNLLS